MLGPRLARRRGVAASCGEFITTLDADDFYADPAKLEREAPAVA